MSIFSSLFGNSSRSYLENLSDSQLDDIGLCRDDVFQASRMGSGAKGFLEQRRAARANG